jgi:hypothetical protein
MFLLYLYVGLVLVPDVIESDIWYKVEWPFWVTHCSSCAMSND